MEIYLSPNTCCRYGGGLNGDLTQLPKYIEKELIKARFLSSFDELNITLSFPPMYMSDGVIGMEKEFFQFYEKFPISRLNRRYKTIQITLKAPEFSEHLDNEEKKNHPFQLPIEEK